MTGVVPRGAAERWCGVRTIGAETGDDCQAVEHYGDTQRPLQGKLDTDGQCGDDQVSK